MNVKKLPDGSIILSDIINGIRVQETYVNTALRVAKMYFRAMIKVNYSDMSGYKYK